MALTAHLLGATGRTRIGPCRVCGRPTMQRETLAGEHRWWSPFAHDAPCGAPRIGGGVRPKTHDELPSGMSDQCGIAHAHREDGCGAEGCEGGRA